MTTNDDREVTPTSPDDSEDLSSKAQQSSSSIPDNGSLSRVKPKRTKEELRALRVEYMRRGRETAQRNREERRKEKTERGEVVKPPFKPGSRLGTPRRIAIARGENFSKKIIPLEVTNRNDPPKPRKGAWPWHKTSEGLRAADYDDPKYTIMTPLVITAYLAALSVSGQPTKVAKELRLDYMFILDLKKSDNGFREKFDEAMRCAFEFQEDEVRRRAFQGYERPIYQMGKLVGHETVYSDALAMTMLKAGAPEKYNPKTIQTIEHAGAVGVTVAAMTDEQLNEAINKKLRFLGAMNWGTHAHPEDVEVKPQPEAIEAPLPEAGEFTEPESGNNG
jgi:hypothetical protein